MDVPHDKLGVPSVTHTLGGITQGVLTVEIAVLEESVTQPNEASLEFVVVHLALDRLSSVVDLMVHTSRKSRDDRFRVTHQRDQPGFVIAKQVVLGTQCGDEGETVVEVSLGIYRSIVAVVGDSATAQARHIDGVTQMKHRVRLPPITKA